MRLSALSSYLLVAIGGAIGSVMRLHAAVVFGARPLTTFGVNIVGSFLIGLLSAAITDAKLRLLFGAGLLGGFTTFSTWQYEALLASRGKGGTTEALVILVGSVLAGLAACFVGHHLGQKFR